MNTRTPGPGAAGSNTAPFPLAVCILAGGRSKRMGRDKAGLPWHGRPLLAHLLSLARSLSPEVYIAGPAARYASFGYPCLDDVQPSSGPLAGIAAVLEASRALRVLCLACDMPRLTPQLLQFLTEQPGTHAWVVPESEPGRLQPLCAIYPRLLLPPVRLALQERRLGVEHALSGQPRRVVSAKELAAAGFTPDLFANLNDPLAYQYAIASPRV